ncbi:phospholipase D-like domain-containing protein [Acinetobacter baumannii]|nr:phospholipase D-like domain-containing protein [Acinetobacter baumannii]
MENKDLIEVNAYFDDIAEHIEKELMQAKESIYICVAWIDWKNFTPIFNKISQKGVKIEVIYNNDEINYKNYIKSSCDVKVFAIKARRNKLMHNKFCIIDNNTIITGSYNWSKQAALHHENILIMKNNYDLIASYLNEFYNLKDHFYYKANPLAQCGYEYINDKIRRINKCRCHTFNLGIVGNEEGNYGDSKMTVWKICSKYPEHIQKLVSDYQHFPLTHSGINGDKYLDYDTIADGEEKISQMISQRNSLELLRKYFKINSNSPSIHAIGVIRPVNQGAYYQEYDPQLSYEIKIIWKEMYFRKDLPNTYDESDSEIFTDIVDEYF